MEKSGHVRNSHTGLTLTFAQFKSMVSKFSHGLLQLGINKNDVVLTFSPNSIHPPLAVGAIATTVKPDYALSELSKQVQDPKSKLIFTVDELLQMVKDLCLPDLLLYASEKSGEIPSIILFSELVNSKGSVNLDSKPYKIKKANTAALLYSLGTTGTSKGTIFTHGNIISAALTGTADQESADEMHNVFLCALPMFRVFGLAAIMYLQLQHGKGYINNQVATKLTIDKQGCVHSGDLGYFDEEGHLFVVDRNKEFFKYTGYQVAQAEFEGLIVSHRQISVVIPTPDAEVGEAPAAYVVRVANSLVTAEDVKKFIADQIVGNLDQGRLP